MYRPNMRCLRPSPSFFGTDVIGIETITTIATIFSPGSNLILGLCAHQHDYNQKPAAVPIVNPSVPSMSTLLKLQSAANSERFSNCDVGCFNCGGQLIPNLENSMQWLCMPHPSSVVFLPNDIPYICTKKCLDNQYYWMCCKVCISNAKLNKFSRKKQKRSNSNGNKNSSNTGNKNSQSLNSEIDKQANGVIAKKNSYSDNQSNMSESKRKRIEYRKNYYLNKKLTVQKQRQQQIQKKSSSSSLSISAAAELEKFEQSEMVKAINKYTILLLK